MPTQALQEVLDHQAHMVSCSGHRWISDTGERLKAFEAAVMAAVAGFAPPEEQLGRLGARDFLNVVHDVTTWSLTNFESFKAPCPATVYYHSWTPEHPERPMRLCVNPGERRNALWVTMALLGADHPAMPGAGGPLKLLYLGPSVCHRTDEAAIIA